MCFTWVLWSGKEFVRLIDKVTKLQSIEFLRLCGLSLCNILICKYVVACVLQEGKLSTGNSLDMSSQDESYIKANDATVKDMEVS